MLLQRIRRPVADVSTTHSTSLCGWDAEPTSAATSLTSTICLQLLVPIKTIPVRLTKHVMYFDVPGEHDMKMGIVHRSIDHAAPCDNGSASR